MLTGVVDRGVVGNDHRRQGTRRQVGNGRQRQRIHLRERTVGIDVALKIVANDAGAEDRPRFLPGHAVGLAGPSFHAVGDIVGDAIGRHPAVERQRLHCGTLEDGKNINRYERDAQDTHHDHRQRHDGDRVGIPQRAANQSIHMQTSSA